MKKNMINGKVRTMVFIVLIGILCGAPTNVSAIPITGISSFEYILDNIKIPSDSTNICSVTNSNPATGINPPISLIFTETKEQMTLQITGGHIVQDNSETFGIMGKYWSGSVGIMQDNGSWDVISMSGSFGHVVGPHSTDGLSGLMQYKLELSGFWVWPFEPSKTVDLKPNPTLHPNEHKDNWSGNIIGNVSITSEINDWNAVIQGNHVAVPEPSSIFLLSSVLIGVIGFKRKRLIKKS